MKDLIGLVICLGLIYVMFQLLAYADEKERLEDLAWERHIKEKNCKLSEVRQGGVQSGSGVGVTATGGMAVVATSSSTPDMEAWICDDGVKYWREI